MLYHPAVLVRLHVDRVYYTLAMPQGNYIVPQGNSQPNQGGTLAAHSAVIVHVLTNVHKLCCSRAGRTRSFVSLKSLYKKLHYYSVVLRSSPACKTPASWVTNCCQIGLTRSLACVLA